MGDELPRVLWVAVEVEFFVRQFCDEGLLAEAPKLFAFCEIQKGLIGGSESSPQEHTESSQRIVVVRGIRPSALLDEFSPAGWRGRSFTPHGKQLCELLATRLLQASLFVEQRLELFESRSALGLNL